MDTNIPAPGRMDTNIPAPGPLKRLTYQVNRGLLQAITAGLNAQILINRDFALFAEQKFEEAQIELAASGERLEKLKRALAESAAAHKAQIALDALGRANEICRSMSAIVDRKGKQTNWLLFDAQLQKVLLEQHAIFHPEVSDPAREAVRCTAKVFKVGL